MPHKANQWPAALTIAGSDSGGGAGIQADLKTFAALRVHGLSAVTCVTAQNPRAVTAIQPCRPDIVRDQIAAVLAGFPVGAVKTGMLFSGRIIRAVAAELPGVPVVVDPVMVSTSGARLLQPSAIKAMTKELLPRASLVTPNLQEAEILLGRPIRELEAARAAARELRDRFGTAFLVKGGHLRGLREAADFYYDGRTELLLTAPYIRGVSTHGTGCTYSAAIAACCARGLPLTEAVVSAKRFISRAIAGSVRSGSHWLLGWDVASSKKGPLG